MSIPFVSLSDTFDQWRSKTNANSVNVGDIVLLTTPVTSDLVSALNEVNQRLVSLDQTALKEVVEDLTPELGGNLNLNSNDIVGVGNIVIDGVISGTISVGGDLTGTTANAQINPNSIGITELNLPDGTAGQFLKTDGIGGLSFDTVLTDASNEVVGGDVSGVVSNIQINPNVVGIDELDVSDGNAGQVLSTDGSGTLSFVDGGIGGVNPAEYEEDILIGDGTTTTFIFPSNTSAPSEEAILVSIDGVIQPTSSYELPLPTSIRFPNTPPDSGATIRVLHLGVVSTVSPGSTLFVEDLFDGNGGTDYTLTEDAPVRETILVYVDGVSQPTTEYSLPTLRTIRFVEAPLIGSSVRVVHLGVAGGIADGSITTPKLADNAVTPAKLGAGVILAQSIAPNSVGISELDVSDGNDGEFLRTNGAGVLEFASVVAGSGGSNGSSSPTVAFQGTTEGYQVGGAIASGGFVRSQLTLIEAYSYIVDGNTNSSVGNLSQGRMGVAGFASSTHGYVVGGRIGENSNTLNSIDFVSTVDKFSFATDNTVTQPFTLAQRIGGHKSHTSETHGYWSGGFIHSGGSGTGGTRVDTLIIDRLLFASDNSSTNVGNLDTDFNGSNTTSSLTDAYHMAGGTRSPEVAINTVRKFSFSSDAASTTIASLTGSSTNRIRRNGVSCCDVTAGYVSSGNGTGGFCTTIEKYTYSTDVVVIEPRTLQREDNGLGGSSSTTHGYASGGTNPPGNTFASGQVTSSNQVQKFAFSNSNNSSDIATLTNATFNLPEHIQH